MDYAGANANSLYKYQWDYIHNPQKMIGLLQDDEEGAVINRIQALIEGMRLSNSLTPGSVVKLPWYGGTTKMSGTLEIDDESIDLKVFPHNEKHIDKNTIRYTVPNFNRSGSISSPGTKIEKHYSCDGYRLRFSQFTVEVDPPVSWMYSEASYKKEKIYKVLRYIGAYPNSFNENISSKISSLNSRFDRETNPDKEEDIVEELLALDIYPTYYKLLSVDLRVAAIKRVMDEKHLIIEITDEEEQEILFLLDNVEDSDIQPFLKKLETETYKGDVLAIRMLKDFQDAVGAAEVFGEQRDYYTSLLQVFIKLAVKDQSRLESLTNHDPTYNIKLSIPAWWEQPNWKDFKYIVGLDKGHLTIQEKCYLPSGPPTQRFNTQGLPIAGVYDTPYDWLDVLPEKKYSPFDLVVLDDRSNLDSDILQRVYRGENVLDGIKVLPAVAMHYVKMKSRNESIEGKSYVAVDIIAMAVGIGELTLATKVISNSRKLVVVFDVLNSATNIAVNTTDIQNDESVQKWLQVYNAANVFANLAVSYRGGKNLVKAVVTNEDYLYYANEAYKVYSKELTTAVQQIEEIAGDLGQVTGRAKRAESAANRLQRAVDNGWIKELNSTEEALDNIWDALGTRVVLKNGDAASVDAFVNKLCNAIEKGEIEVVSVNSLAGADGIPYLTQTHLEQIKSACLFVGKQIKALPKEYESGYTVATIYLKYKNNVRGELQLIGQQTLEIANAEHWVYDAFLGKPYAEYLEGFTNVGTKDIATRLIKRVREPAMTLSESQKATYNSYLNSVYQNARNIESGNSLSTVTLPSGIPQELSAESLLRTDQLINGLKNGTISNADALNFLNGK
jgi:hypothetical protein